MISSNYKQVEQLYNNGAKNSFDTIEEFEEYFLQEFSERVSGFNAYTGKDMIERKIPPVDHAEPKEYEIWQESGDPELIPMLLGKEKGRNFAQACHIFMCKAYLKDGYAASWLYDPKYLTFNDRKLHWSERNAKLKQESLKTKQ